MLKSQIQHLWGLFPPFENSKNSKYEFLVKESHENTLKKKLGETILYWVDSGIRMNGT